MVSAQSSNRHVVRKGDARLERFFKPKRFWPLGTWQDEPDEYLCDLYVDYPGWAYRGYFGAWFLFVGVKVGHPYYLRKAHDMPYVLHIPFTYAGNLSHLKVPVKGGFWWFGLHYGNQWCASPYDIVNGEMGKPYVALQQVERDAQHLAEWFHQHTLAPHGVTDSTVRF